MQILNAPLNKSTSLLNRLSALNPFRRVRDSSVLAAASAFLLTAAGIAGFMPGSADVAQAEAPAVSEQSLERLPSTGVDQKPCARQNWPYLSANCLAGPAREVRVLSPTATGSVIVLAPTTAALATPAAPPAATPPSKPKKPRRQR
jgi:hypothetical protein